MDINTLTSKVIGAAIEVHKHLGPGLLESVYENCLCHELKQHKINYKNQIELPIAYKGMQLNSGLRLDILVENSLILELKACEKLEPIHTAQLLSYLRLTGKEIGLLLNFNVPLMKDGIIRIANNFTCDEEK